MNRRILIRATLAVLPAAARSWPVSAQPWAARQQASGVNPAALGRPLATRPPRVGAQGKRGGLTASQARTRIVNRTFTSAAPITVPPDSAVSVPYPSTIQVGGFHQGRILKARVSLLGFSHNETAKFTWPLLKSLEPHARAYVIAVDKFFFERESPPAAEIMHVADTRERYDAKRAWQAPHRLICGTLPALCGDSVSYYRQRDTGQWRLLGSDGITAQKIESDRPEYIKGDPELLATITANAKAFLDDLEGLGVERSCVILTYLPSTENNRLLANALATELDMPLIAPQGEGLVTMDSSHLDPPSAQVFTAGFLKDAGPRLADCLDGKVAGG